MDLNIKEKNVPLSMAMFNKKIKNTPINLSNLHHIYVEHFINYIANCQVHA